ncbi:hypothetical protein K4A83_02340 [Spirulina subsalsa FACHB-351]|uniref:VWFA domain-containing protein n=1 Tax=Spirulina subsalsa FACHB-351 TaxID=234711 RepID=A0ABT3L1M4_9CYAN|nr:hypothetical protein [Spirulina subsalsa]MCW6035112.1 hypothetical protein [Spirulina subsalsa FACHB-351]
MLEARDYTLIIDKSGSMSQIDPRVGKSHWEIMQESTLALAIQCEMFDPDGITVYVFSGRFRRYDHVTSDRVARIFQENTPTGHTGLCSALEDALHSYFERKALGQSKPNGETFLVVTDGNIKDRGRLIRLILDASQRIERDDELAISFIQVGHNGEATRFLKVLDDQLQGAGARFDIVDTLTIDEMGEMTLTDVLIHAIVD